MRSGVRPPGLARNRHGFGDGCRLHLAPVAGDLVAGEDFAHAGSSLRAALEGVGAAECKR